MFIWKAVFLSEAEVVLLMKPHSKPVLTSGKTRPVWNRFAVAVIRSLLDSKLLTELLNIIGDFKWRLHRVPDLQPGDIAAGGVEARLGPIWCTNQKLRGREYFPHNPPELSVLFMGGIHGKSSRHPQRQCL